MSRYHELSLVDGRHPIHAISEFADTTARDAYTYAVKDIGKVVATGAGSGRQFWLVKNVSAGTATFVELGTATSTPSAHASSHLPGGSDALATAAAGTILPDDAAAEGSASAFARSDHKHAIAAAAAGAATPGDSATEGSASSFARSDHKHLLPAFGSASGTFCEGNDARLSNARTPSAHASSHQSGGSDAIKLDDLSAPDDNTDLNASTSAHGLLRKLSGTTTQLLDGGGNWNTSINSRISALESVSPIITQWTPDAPPTGSAHAKTDEFDSGSAWNARWTEFDQSAELTPTVADGFGLMTVADAGASRSVAMYQAVPAVAAYCFGAKMHMAQLGNVTGAVQMGLFLSQDLGSAPTTADWEGIRLAQGNLQNFATYTATAYNAAFGALSGNLSRTDRSAYFRCRVTSTTTVAWDWSDDGIGWHELTSHTIGFTPVHMGVFARNSGTGGIAVVRTQWFRVVEATVANGDLVPGGRVLNVFA